MKTPLLDLTILNFRILNFKLLIVYSLELSKFYCLFYIPYYYYLPIVVTTIVPNLSTFMFQETGNTVDRIACEDITSKYIQTVKNYLYFVFVEGSRTKIGHQNG